MMAWFRRGAARRAAPARPAVRPSRAGTRVGRGADPAAGAGRLDARHRPALPRPHPDDGGAADPGAQTAGRTSASRSRPATTLTERLRLAADIAYLAFTAGYAPASGPRRAARGPGRRGGPAGPRAARGAARRRRLPSEVDALLALILLQHSRRDARIRRRRRRWCCWPTRTAPAGTRTRSRGAGPARAADDGTTRAVPAAGADRGRARDRAHGRGHRLVPDRRPLPGAGGPHRLARRQAQPGRGRGRGRRTARGSRAPRRPRPAGAPAPRRCGASCWPGRAGRTRPGGVRRGDRAVRQRRRASPPCRPARRLTGGAGPGLGQLRLPSS